MVGFKNMAWLPDIAALMSGGESFSSQNKKKSQRLGILAFETAKIMSRLGSLYRSLSDDEICRLRKDVMKSEGVAYLNSVDEGFLMRLACAEMLEDLDRAASFVSRVGKKCSDLGLNRFDLLYADLKLRIVDVGKLQYGSRVNEKKLQKMEKWVAATVSLHEALEGLTELELSARKMKQWDERKLHLQKANFDHFNEKLENQRKMVAHFREISLWCETYNKSVALMARIVCLVYSRICVVFDPFVPRIPSFSLRKMGCSQPLSEIDRMMEPIKEHYLSYSDSIIKTPKPTLVRFHSQRSVLFDYGDGFLALEKFSKNNGVFHAAGPSTLGGSGLALRYANVILLAEKYLDSAESIDHIDREFLYQMLPENVKVLVRAKLSKNMKSAEDDVLLAAGWRDAMIEMLGWLAPVAHSTVKWQSERNFEKTSTRLDSNPSVLLMQTLHFADKEKTEAAIVELLVGLSFIYRYEKRRICV